MWEHRGILSLSKEQKNPSVGTRPLYTGLDVIRIRATKALIDKNVPEGEAARIALRLERGHCAQGWRRALDLRAQSVSVFVANVDVVDICIGADAREALNHLTILNEPTAAGAERQLTWIQKNASCYEIGPEVCEALQTLQERIAGSEPLTLSQALSRGPRP
jgi:hypothetical protein